MEAFEEVADTFSDCEGCQDYFSSRMGSLSLSFTSTSYDPAFTFDTSSDSSSLTVRCWFGEVLWGALAMRNTNYMQLMLSFN